MTFIEVYNPLPNDRMCKKMDAIMDEQLDLSMVDKMSDMAETQAYSE